MLNCELCNYIKNIQAKNIKEAKYICEFTSYDFYEDICKYETHPHPCFGHKHHGNIVNMEVLTEVNIDRPGVV